MNTDDYLSAFRKAFPLLASYSQEELIRLFLWFHQNPPPENFYYLQFQDESCAGLKVTTDSGVTMWRRK